MTEAEPPRTAPPRRRHGLILWLGAWAAGALLLLAWDAVAIGRTDLPWSGTFGASVALGAIGLAGFTVLALFVTSVLWRRLTSTPGSR